MLLLKLNSADQNIFHILSDVLSSIFKRSILILALISDPSTTFGQIAHPFVPIKSKPKKE
jgi:hypothetical protein